MEFTNFILKCYTSGEPNQYLGVFNLKCVNSAYSRFEWSIFAHNHTVQEGAIFNNAVSTNFNFTANLSPQQDYFIIIHEMDQYGNQISKNWEFIKGSALYNHAPALPTPASSTLHYSPFSHLDYPEFEPKFDFDEIDKTDWKFNTWDKSTKWDWKWNLESVKDFSSSIEYARLPPTTSDEEITINGMLHVDESDYDSIITSDDESYEDDSTSDEEITGMLHFDQDDQDDQDDQNDQDDQDDEKYLAKPTSDQELEDLLKDLEMMPIQSYPCNDDTLDKMEKGELEKWEADINHIISQLETPLTIDNKDNKSNPSPNIIVVDDYCAPTNIPVAPPLPIPFKTYANPLDSNDFKNELGKVRNRVTGTKNETTTPPRKKWFPFFR